MKASQTDGAGKLVLTAAGVATVVVSWAVVHVFTLRYAQSTTRPGRGHRLQERRAPDYQDFAYVALTIGMTFQIADTDVQARLIRRTVPATRCWPTCSVRSSWPSPSTSSPT